MRYRWMYYATGLPGWMRFGYSPGWAGRGGPGRGPCAYYAMTGRWPTAPAWGWPGFQSPSTTPEAELAALKTQAQWLKSQLDTISQRIEELEK